MTLRARNTFYALIMLLVGIVVVGVYFDNPRPSATAGDTAAVVDDGSTYVPSANDGPVVDAKPERVS